MIKKETVVSIYFAQKGVRKRTTEKYPRQSSFDRKKGKRKMDTQESRKYETLVSFDNKI